MCLPYGTIRPQWRAVDLGRKVFVSLFQSPHVPLPSNQGRQRPELDSASGKGVNFQGENKRARAGFKYFFGENKAGSHVNLENLLSCGFRFRGRADRRRRPLFGRQERGRSALAEKAGRRGEKRDELSKGNAHAHTGRVCHADRPETRAARNAATRGMEDTPRILLHPPGTQARAIEMVDSVGNLSRPKCCR
jgi:hypothetical protein